MHIISRAGSVEIEIEWQANPVCIGSGVFKSRTHSLGGCTREVRSYCPCRFIKQLAGGGNGFSLLNLNSYQSVVSQNFHRKDSRYDLHIELVLCCRAYIKWKYICSLTDSQVSNSFLFVVSQKFHRKNGCHDFKLLVVHYMNKII